MKLVITEKPSQGVAFSKVLGASKRGKGYYEGNGYIVSWCIGHLVGLALPEVYSEEYKKWDNLPVIPEKWIYTVNKSTADQFGVVKRLMNDKKVTSIVCATDAGREGELIFRLVYEYVGCKKPVERLWISSLEDEAIRRGFDNLRPSKEYDKLYASALCRERADWLIGINGTRYFTVHNNNELISVGRVQTPTLAMIVQRDREISSFVKQKYYTVEIDCGEYIAESERIDDYEKARLIAMDCETASARVTEVTTKNKYTSEPKLFDLTALQREANRLFGFTAKETLDTAQKLYEMKLITYPRTDSRYLTDDMDDTASKVIGLIKKHIPFAGYIDFKPFLPPILDSGKVSDHHAIIPTVNIADVAELSDNETKILYLICARLLEATAGKYAFKSTNVEVECNGRIFKASGTALIEPGYKAITQNFRQSVGLKFSDEVEQILPDDISEGEAYTVTAALREHYTMPPKAYTEDTLLLAMENAGKEQFEKKDVERVGLGTPATRAAIIEALVKRGYIKRKGRMLCSADMGKKIVDTVPDVLKSADMTADWENMLALITKGENSDKVFIQDIKTLVNRIVSGEES